jgi:DNA/RNA endonuclease G (NUC1)
MLLIIFLSLNGITQIVNVSGYKFKIKHNNLTFYIDKDTASFMSSHCFSYEDLLKIDGDRSNKWHKETPFGAYNKNAYHKTGYDLGHLTPSNITSYDDLLNYHSFSFFNQAPQISTFNRGKWSKLEKKIIKGLLSKKSGATIITGVIYDKVSKKLPNSRIKIPIYFYKIVVMKNSKICYIGSNINGLVSETKLENIVKIGKNNLNTFSIKIKN